MGAVDFSVGSLSSVCSEVLSWTSDYVRLCQTLLVRHQFLELSGNWHDDLKRAGDVVQQVLLPRAAEAGSCLIYTVTPRRYQQSINRLQFNVIICMIY